MRLSRSFALGLFVLVPRLASAQAQVPVPGGYAASTAPLCPLSQVQTINGASYAAGQAWVPCGTYGTTGIDLNGAAFGGEFAMVPGMSYAPGRSVKADCSGGGYVSVTYADGSTGRWQVAAGVQTLPVAAAAVNAAGTTATCSYAGMR